MFEIIGNKVKIKATPETEEKGLAGLTGEIYGETTPSMMDFEVIGTPKEDYAVNVHFDDLEESFWFDADLLEYIDDGEGTAITLDGIDKKWTKGKDGEWVEEATVSTKGKSTEIIDKQEARAENKKWWQFWKNLK